MTATPESFSEWVYTKLGRTSLAKLSIEARIVYGNLHAVLNGRDGRRFLPERETALKIGNGLTALGKVADASEALIAAGYLPDNYIEIAPKVFMVDRGSKELNDEALAEIVSRISKATKNAPSED